MSDLVERKKCHYGLIHTQSVFLEGGIGLQRIDGSYEKRVAERVLFPAFCFDDVLGVDIDVFSLEEYGSSTSREATVFRKLYERCLIKAPKTLYRRNDGHRERMVAENTLCLVADKMRCAFITEAVIAQFGLDSTQMADDEWQVYNRQTQEKFGYPENEGSEVPSRMQLSRDYKEKGMSLLRTAQSKYEDMEMQWWLTALSLSDIKVTSAHAFMGQDYSNQLNPFIEVMVPNVPMPHIKDLEAVVDLMTDASLKRQYSKMRRWVVTLLDQNIPEAEKRERVEDELADTARVIAETKFRSTMGICRLAVSATLGMVEDALKLRLESLANRPFDIALKAMEINEAREALTDKPLYLAWKMMNPGKK